MKTEMKHELTAEEKNEIFDSVSNYNGSLRESILAHAATYGIDNIEMLFPDATNVDGVQEVDEENKWVGTILNGVSKTPFSRVKTIYVDLTDKSIRAKGYLKGNLKKEDVVSLLKRSTSPQTVYVKEKFDRDDLIDIKNFAATGWIKQQMTKAIKYEIARAILIGDGRLEDDEDKIKEEHIRSIWNDNGFFTINKTFSVVADASDIDIAKEFIKEMIKARKEYKGSGNPVLFAREDLITSCLLIEDANGRRIYNNVNELATTLRAKSIVEISEMENCTRKVSGVDHTLMGLYGNLNDYRIGTDKGKKVMSFEDFDIDFNQYKYLMETRLAGAIVKPYSFISIETVQKTSDPVTP